MIEAMIEGVMNVAQLLNDTCDQDAYPHSRVAVLYVENAAIGDDVFVYELAATLREYADMIDRRKAGCVACEKFKGPRGTNLTISHSTWYGEQVPYD